MSQKTKPTPAPRDAAPVSRHSAESPRAILINWILMVLGLGAIMALAQPVRTMTCEG